MFCIQQLLSGTLMGNLIIIIANIYFERNFDNSEIRNLSFIFIIRSTIIIHNTNVREWKRERERKKESPKVMYFSSLASDTYNRPYDLRDEEFSDCPRW